MEDLRNRAGKDRWNGWKCYPVLTDQSVDGKICILSTVFLHFSKKETKSMWFCSWNTKYLEPAEGNLSLNTEFILPRTITTLSHIRKMNICVHDFMPWWLLDNHWWIAISVNGECTIASLFIIVQRKAAFYSNYISPFLFSAFVTEILKGQNKTQLKYLLGWFIHIHIY